MANTLLLCVSLIFEISAGLKIPLYGALQGDSGRLKKRSTEVPLSGKPEQGYCIDIFLGTPAQRFSVVVDTGSSNFAISGALTSGISKYFDKSASSSWVESDTSNKPIAVAYFNGSWEGDLGSDQFKFCETCSSGMVDVALIRTSHYFFVNETLWQGILGLGYYRLVQPDSSAANTVLDSLESEGVVTNVFSMTLCGRENQDSINLNGVLELDADITNETEYVYTDIVKEWYYQVMVTDVAVNGSTLGEDCYKYNKPAAFIDSGTTNIVAPTDVWFTLVTTIQTYAKYKLKVDNITISDLGQFLNRNNFLCTIGKTAIFAWFPELTFSIAYNTTFSFSVNVPSEQYIRQTWSSIQRQREISDTTYCYMFGIEAARAGIGLILGAAFLEQLEVLHDRENSRIGFKVADCQVSDPVFNKTISELTKRTDAGSCATAPTLPSWIVPVAAICGFILIVSCTLLYWIYTSREFLRQASPSGFFGSSSGGKSSRPRARPSRVSGGEELRRNRQADPGVVIENEQTTENIVQTIQGNEPDVV